MKPAPIRSPAEAALRAPTPSPAPIALPTRIAAAEETPSGTMNVNDARLMVTWWAAICTVPRPPMRRAMTANATISSWTWKPIGAPRRTIRHNGCNRNTARSKRPRNGPRSLRAAINRTTKNSVLAAVVAHAEPMGPSCGIGPAPNTNAQSATRLKRLTTTMVMTIGRTRPIAWSDCRSTKNP